MNVRSIVRFTGLILVAAAGLAVSLVAHAQAQQRVLTVASTTSTQNSGLFDHILPQFFAQTGIEVRVVAVGTGQAIRLAERGDADVLLVHHEPSERRFVAEGFGVQRHDVMYNDFVIVGPEDDPAGIAGMRHASDAMRRIGEAKATFASRGDDSGTHKQERALWQAAEKDVADASGDWYRETGSGMGATLNTARALGAYTLTDRATWISFANKGDLKVLVEGDARLYNPYGVILVNPERHPHVNAEAGQTFIDWLTSAAGQRAIASYRVDGNQLFFPSAAGRGS
jgi:tungstate transport system substrate-binding protein